MSDENVVLAMPSCRPEQAAEFFRAWKGKGGWSSVVLMEDSDLNTGEMADAVKESEAPIETYCHRTVKRELQENSWIISQQDSACRAWAIFKAWQAGAEWVLTLDDDVRPSPRMPKETTLVALHVAAMTERSYFQSSVHGLSPRGMPSYPGKNRQDVKASMGLWEGVPDLYAADMLEGYDKDYKPPLSTRLIPDGEFVPICGMNLCIHRNAVPLCYFPPQGKGQPYSRFDDIWMGLVLKACLDVMQWKLSVGEPHVFHSRASDPVKCAAKEAPGRMVNDAYWNLMPNMLDELYGMVKQPDYLAEAAGEALSAAGAKRGDAYLERWGKALGIWSNLFNRGKKQG